MEMINVQHSWSYTMSCVFRQGLQDRGKNSCVIELSLLTAAKCPLTKAANTHNPSAQKELFLFKSRIALRTTLLPHYTLAMCYFDLGKRITCSRAKTRACSTCLARASCISTSFLACSSFIRRK